MLNLNDDKTVYQTNYGKIIHDDSLDYMKTLESESIDLVMTSPPFSLIREKDYGNKYGQEYWKWFKPFAEEIYRILKKSGSLVIEIGGAWNKGQPTRNLYHYELLINMVNQLNYYLAQDFYWWNPSKLPNPIEWVNIRKVRVKDAVTCIWWFSKTPYPKSSNQRVLQPYSKSQEYIQKNGYQSKKRPSGHDISKTFNSDNGGSIPPNLIAVANTKSNSYYFDYCKEKDIKPHPARYPIEIPSYFIRMLTDKEDLILDPFAGSCTTGKAAELQDRNWICIDKEIDYLKGAVGNLMELKNVDKNVYDYNHIRYYSITSPSIVIKDENESPLKNDGGETRPK